LAAVAESNQAVVDLLREMTVESLYQIAARGDDFQVYEGATTPYASPKSFDLEALLQDADERKREWGRVRELIEDLRTPVGFRHDLGDRDEVTIKGDDWKVLSEIGAGTSVAEIADLLGTTEFWTARIASRLVKNELIQLRGTPDAADELDDVVVESEPDSQYVVPSAEPSVFEAERAETSDREEFDAEPPVFQDAVEGENDEDIDPDESWWQEPDVEDEPVEEDESPTPEVVSEGLSEIPPVEASDDDPDVGEDTEAFLEKVFSELDSSENEDEADEGHGLLRRRRMGMLRDFSSDS
jgi:hypothetical protein